MNSNIKALILDVDGVLVGEKIGFNSPYPHFEVIQRLKLIRKRGIPISLCTAKPHYAVQKIIDDAQLNNLHITEGGAVVINSIDNLVFKKHTIDSKDVIEVLEAFLKQDIYTEFYTIDKYVIQQDQVSNLTKTHTHILQKEPKVVLSLMQEARGHEIVKIMPIVKNERDKEKLTKLFEPFKDNLTLSWGVHPIALPHQFGIITAKGISKKQAAVEIAENENVKIDEILAVGDSTSDWQFIESCGYSGAMGNASDELKRLVSTKKNHYIGNSVDDNGVLSIFDYFKI